MALYKCIIIMSRSLIMLWVRSSTLLICYPCLFVTWETL